MCQCLHEDFPNSRPRSTIASILHGAQGSTKRSMKNWVGKISESWLFNPIGPKSWSFRESSGTIKMLGKLYTDNIPPSVDAYNDNIYMKIHFGTFQSSILMYNLVK